MKQTRNKIINHQTECLECGHYWKPELIQSILYEQGKESVNMQCFCGTRHRIIENVNGWIVFRRYIKKKDQVKRVKKSKELLRIKSNGDIYLEGNKLEEEFLKKVFSGMLNQLKNDNNSRTSTEQV